MEHCVVAGAGLAGLNTVMALRTRGYEGRLTLLGAEPHPPYDRPPLSKQLLDGRVDDPTLPADWAGLGVDCRWETAATGLRDGAVDTAAGPVPCDAAVIATGAAPVRLPGDGPQRTLRTVEDARALRKALRPGASVAIVGAGWIGAEVATAAAAAGCRVTVVEAAAHPLATALPAEVAVPTTPWWAGAGVELLTDTSVRSVVVGGLELADGSFLAADEVLVAVGVRPVTAWLDGSGLTLGDGVVVDERLAARPGVCAVGDVAAWWSARYGERLRVEHWDTALRAPAVVASTLLGGDDVYDPVPYVWSEQFGRYTQYAGRHTQGDSLVWRGDPATDAAWAACWLRDDRLRAVFAVDRPRDAVQGRRVAERGQPVDAARLADPAVPIKLAVADR
ncbi:MAG: NAD(P)/FAD-dependent oxidoreductase [Streptosporangiales bacterium]|nr:NAD(P)/FAD-dependent oxidoreductase [Streptosporangiales bacterium]